MEMKRAFRAARKATVRSASLDSPRHLTAIIGDH